MWHDHTTESARGMKENTLGTALRQAGGHCFIARSASWAKRLKRSAAESGMNRDARRGRESNCHDHC